MTKQTDNEAFARRIQAWLSIPVDGWAGENTVKAFNARVGLVEETAQGNRIPDSYFTLLSKIESGDRPYIKAPTSSGSGLYQFIRSTWLGEGGRWGSDMSKAFGGLTPPVSEQTERARSFTQKNADALQRAGIPVNNASLYAIHFLGAGTAIKALRGALTDPIADHVDDGAIAANPTILGVGKTVKDFIDWLERKTGVRAK